MFTSFIITTKAERIQQRLEQVRWAIPSWSMKSSVRFDDIVSETGFSRNEVAYHLSILKKARRITGNAENGYRLEATSGERTRSYNRFVHGCESPVHVFGVGYFDPSTREGKRRLDG